MKTLRQNVDAAVLETFERLGRRQLRSRLRIAIWLGLTLVPPVAISNVVILVDRMPARMAGFASILVLDAVVLGLLRTRLAWRAPAAIAVGYTVALTVCLLYLLSLSPGDLGTLVTPLGVLLVGTALLFPWGAGTQGLLSGGTVAGFSALLLAHDPPGSVEKTYNVVLALVLTAGLSVVTACILQGLRFETCVHRWRVQTLAIQRRRLLQLGRELRESLDPELLLNRIAQHARRLVPADFVAVASRDLEGGRLRLSAFDGDSDIEGMLGLDLPPDFAAKLCASLARSGIQETPGSEADALVGDLVTQLGFARRLAAAIGPSHRLLGFLAWHRRADQPFTYYERLAAEGIADQAYTTLSAARLYARALESSRLKSEFVSTVSHEFRTPLSVIIGYAEMAADPEISDADRRAGLEGIAQSARELLLLVEHTLDISRIDAGQDRPDEDLVNLETFWSGLHDMCGHLPRSPEVQLEWQEPLPRGLMRTDRRRLGIIVRNLVSNALKFTERGHVRVLVDVDDTDLVIRVRDTGIGIAPEDQPVIFEIFRQADGSETRKFEGTGLGLYIVSRFTEKLRGSVRLQSEVGRGSTFEVRIPGVLRAPAEGFEELVSAAPSPPD